MPERKTKMQTVNVTDARQQFSGLINRVFKERARVMIEKQGIPVAALISTQDLERLDQLEAQRQRDFGALRETAEAFKDVPVDELERQVARAIASVRAERRKREVPQAKSQAQRSRSTRVPRRPVA